MNERLIQRGIYYQHVGRYDLLLPNFTPGFWFEADVWGITKSGYGVEWEIKLTRSDFLADAKKRGPDEWRPYKDRMKKFPAPATKHQRMKAGDEAGPSRFFFVIPKGLVPLEEIPEWAGVYHILDRRGVRLRRQAPRLHNKKVDPKIREAMLKASYYRFWTERLKNSS